MVQTNVADKEVSLKIIYYGLPNSGKKSNLNFISQQSAQPTEISKEDYGYVLRYIPEKSLHIAGMKVTCLLYAVTHGTLNSQELKEVFQGIDGVVFVVDSDRQYQRENVKAFEELQAVLKANGYNFSDIALVMQWNKQDLEQALAAEELNTLLNENASPTISASAVNSDGILQTLNTILDDICENVEGHLRSPSRRLPKKKLGIAVPKKTKEEKNAKSKVDDSGKNKIKLSVAKKWKVKTESQSEETDNSSTTEEINTEPEATATNVAPPLPSQQAEESPAPVQKRDAINDETEEFIQPPEFFEEEDMVVSSSKKTISLLDAETKEDIAIASPQLPMATTPLPMKKLAPPANKAKTYEKKHSLNIIDMAEAIELLQAGQPLENVQLEILDLSNHSFEQPIQINKCHIDSLVADGVDFKASITLENAKFKDVAFCKDIPSIFRSTITLKNIEVAGEFCLQQCMFCKEIAITDSSFNGSLKMQDAVCEENLSILNSKIVEIACQRSRFCSSVLISGSDLAQTSFEKCTFSDACLISSSNFKRAHFMSSLCREQIEFVRCIFDKIANYTNIHCDKGITIEGCVFNGYFNLNQAYLKGESYFTRTEFSNDVSLHQLLAIGSLVWEKVTFLAIADFSRAHFNKVEFLQVVFQSVANFQESIFSEYFSLLECEFNERVHFNHAIFFQKVDFRGTHWERVSFANIIADYIVLERKQIQKKLLVDEDQDYSMAEQEYLTLKRMFAKQALNEDKDWAHYHAKRAARKNTPISLLAPHKALFRFFNWLFWDLGCGYGTKPARIIGIAIVFITMFAALYLYFFPQHIGIVDQDTNTQAWKTASWHSIVTFMPTGVSQRELLGADPFSFHSLFQVTMLGENLLGLFLTFLFFMVLIRRLLQN